MDVLSRLLSYRPPQPALPDVEGAIEEAKRRQIRVYPQHKNRASEAGHPCERYLVLLRTRWQERAPHDVGLQYIFDAGNDIEARAIADLRDAGFTVVEQQRAFEWPELELTGHIDGKLVTDGEAFPFDVKSISGWDFERIQTPADLLSSDKLWHQKWPAQMLLYLLMDGTERGFLLLKSKQTYRPRALWFDLNDGPTLDRAESTLKKLERVNTHVRAGTLPPGIDDAEVCPDCPFFHICLPEIRREAIDLSTDPDLIAKLQRRAELEAARKEYEALDKAVKEALSGKERVIVGDFLVTGKQVTRKAYTVPESTYWQTKIVRLEPPSGESPKAAPEVAPASTEASPSTEARRRPAREEREDAFAACVALGASIGWDEERVKTEVRQWAALGKKPGEWVRNMQRIADGERVKVGAPAQTTLPI